MSSETRAVSPIVAVTLTPTATNLPDGKPRDDAQPQATDYRLVIEQGPRSGSYVYKTVDRTTGETIKQFPREEVVKLINDPLYATGTIANTKV